MINYIIKFSIGNKLIVGLLMLGLIGWGAFSLTQLPFDAVPDITDNQIQVITTSPNLAAQEVEQLITFPLEMELGNIPGVVELRSISRFGLSVITLVFEEQLDIYFARQLVNERIQGAKELIPPGLGLPEMGPITTGLGEIYQYVLYPDSGYKDQYSSVDLRTIQDWLVKRQLRGIEGVIEVNSSGGHLKQYEISINPEKLHSFHLSLTDIFEAVSKNNGNTGGSYIEKDQYAYFIRGEGLIKGVQDIENILVDKRGETLIRISDVAEVSTGHAPRFGAVTMNGIGEVVAGQVLMLKGENPAEVTQRVRKRMEQIRQSLPEGILIEPYLDRTKLVNRTTRTISINLLEGGLIVIFVLVMFLGNLRAGLIVASVIPLSLLFAASMMSLTGVSANLMSLGAIDFGLIVDGAIIIVEAILFHLSMQQSPAPLSTDQINTHVFLAASKIRNSAAFGEIIILIVYLPILFLSGIEGKMFKPMAQTVSFAILGALILSITYVPMMSALLLGKKKAIHKKVFSDKLLDFLQQAYKGTIVGILKHRWAILILTLFLFGLSIWRLDRMGGEFIPTLEEGDLALHQILPTGSSISQGVEVSAELQKILLDNFPEVEKVVTKIGTAEIPTDIMPLEAGDIYVILKPKDQWTSAQTREELFDKMEAKMNTFPGVMYEFTQPIQMRFNELMTGVRQDIAIKIFGENIGILANKAEEAKHILQTIEGVGDIQVEPTAGLQQIVIEYDRQKLGAYGLDIETINQHVKGSFAGLIAGQLLEGEKRFDIVVRLGAAYRNNLQQIKKLYIPLPSGGQVPLTTVAKVAFEEGPSQISRDNTQRRIVIGVNARNRDVQSLVTDIQTRLQSALDLPPGYYVTYGGQFENLQRARKRLWLATPVALLLIFLLLYFTFRSLKQTFMIFTAIPLAAIGGIWALVIRGMPFSISAGIGFIALFGVAVLNGIVLIAYYNQLKQEGWHELVERIKQGALVRLRPILMTATVASLGFLPMAVSTAAGAEVQQPLATVVIGGLITSTLLSLVILPILYYLSESRGKVNTLSIKKVSIWLLFGTCAFPAFAQDNLIDLEEAVSIARNNALSLQRDSLYVAQQEALSMGSLLAPKVNIFATGEEIGSGNESVGSGGIQSLGFLQTFYLPSYRKSSIQVQQQKVAIAGSQLQMTHKALERAIREAYIQSLYAAEVYQLYKEAEQMYQEFLRVAQAKFDQGETGRTPLLNAETRLSQGKIQTMQAEMAWEIALQQFNNLLFADQFYRPIVDSLPYPQAMFESYLGKHPQIEMAASQLRLATSNIRMSKSRMLPQIQTGGQIQSIGGDVPFWGYQLGLIFPLSKKSYKTAIQSAFLREKALQAELENQQRLLSQRHGILKMELVRLAKGFGQMDMYVVPLAEKQWRIAEAAYFQGELSYLSYMQTLDQLVVYAISRLDTLRMWNLTWAEWLYWFEN